jgi:hypothetical protein
LFATGTHLPIGVLIYVVAVLMSALLASYFFIGARFPPRSAAVA